MKHKCTLGLFIVAMVAAPSIIGFVSSGDPPTLEDLRRRPITTDGDRLGQLLKQWYKDGTAAGNAGDFYDNRDGDHSPLDLKRYPQLSAIKYSPQEIKANKHWGGAGIIRPQVTFGNSSTSAPAHLGGSNPRAYTVSFYGTLFLYNQYTRNNLYIYPEHHDHDPGHNGVFFPNPLNHAIRDEGYGDLYPTNTPYLIISQGSSGSDQPFMRMMPLVLAAFRPEVKKKLTETGLLMPTIQMLMRSTSKHLKNPKEYLTGKAHPSVFEGSWVDERTLVEKAHAIELKALPPMVQLRVTEEDKAVDGIDYFDPVKYEVLANTPACIARIHRSKAYQRRIVVNADASYDINKAPLTYSWVILRGDPDKIKIVPKKDDRSSVEITVAYHDRRPVSPGSPLESNRVDIGVFVHNGTHYSAPGFVTFYTLDREARAYDERGVPLEIAYGMGETEIRVNDWTDILGRLLNDQPSKLFGVTEKQAKVFTDVVTERRLSNVRLRAAQDALRQAEAAMRRLNGPAEKKRVEDARKQMSDVQKSLDDLLDGKQKELDDSPRHFVEARLDTLTKDPLFILTHANWIKKNRNVNEFRIKSAWQKLIRFGIANNKNVLTPLRPGKTLADAKWTTFERAQIEELNASLIADLAFPGLLQMEHRVNYVDDRLSAPREWRDVFRYDPKGAFIGWTRYGPDGVQTFNHDGLLVVEKDAAGRCLKGRMVSYVRDAQRGQEVNMLRAALGDTIVRYEFDGKEDWRGRRSGTEPVKDKKK